MSSINRRRFLGGMAAGGAAVAAAATPDAARAEPFMREAKARSENAYGLLYDSTLCIGCKACVAGCKEANGMPVEIPAELRDWNEGTWDTAKDLSGDTLNVIKVYMHGTVAEKDRAENGFAFVKRQCLHCVDPSCMSACPVSAMIKDPETGIVSHDADRCIGCRYCVYACPFGGPKYEYDDPFGKIQKCQLCNHLLPEGKLPGCVETCPTGATLFGRYDDLQKEAHRRLELQPGDAYEYPRGDVSEEFARIASHLAQARSILAAAPEVGQGKTLDFISQELHREVSTIGSKITSHAGSAVVIEAKRSIERIREQVQNVE